MLRSMHAAALLDGGRGWPGVDEISIIEPIERISTLLRDLPEIEELDPNPVLAFERGPCTLDDEHQVARRR